MEISIITPCLNAERTILQSIDSVLGQVGVELELVVVDGGSSDGTLEILSKIQDSRLRVISGKDKGIYDAINKGIKQSVGEWVGVLNSDDFYVDERVLKNVLAFAGKAEVVYGDIVIVDREDSQKIRRKWKAGVFDPLNLLRGWAPPHPAFFCRKTVFEKLGFYRTDLSLAGDYEFMLRCFYVFGMQSAYIPQVLAVMRDGGASSQDLRRRLVGFKQIRQSWLVNGLKAPKFLVTKRVLSKLKQYFK